MQSFLTCLQKFASRAVGEKKKLNLLVNFYMPLVSKDDFPDARRNENNYFRTRGIKVRFFPSNFAFELRLWRSKLKMVIKK